MEQIVAIAAIRIGRADPDGNTERGSRVRMPGLCEIIPHPELFRQSNIPSSLLVQGIAGPLWWEVIVIFKRIQLHSEAPLLQIIKTNNCPRLCFRLVQGRKNQRH